MLDQRLAKRFRHLSKWSRRTNSPCFRVYERDIPEFPLVVDWYDGDVVVWIHQRTRDDTPESEEAFVATSLAMVRSALEVDLSRVFVKRRQRQRGLSQYERISEASATRVVTEHGLKFEVNLSDYLDTGLFLDHRTTRSMVRERALGKRLLNLFAYTGAFTVHAAAGGASETLTVDMSNTYQSWTARNLELNGFKVGPAHRLEAADCLQFLEAAPKAGEAYDIIVLDPPTFSNSKRMVAGSFSIDRDWVALLTATMKWLAPQGQIWFSTNSRSFRPDSSALPVGTAFREITRYTVPEDFSARQPHRAFLVAHDGPGAVDLRVKNQKETSEAAATQGESTQES